MNFHLSARVLDDALIDPESTVEEAIGRLDRAGTGALALCAPNRELVGILTDGDIRRAILRGVELTEPSRSIANLNPITAHASITAAEALQLMIDREIDQLPVVDKQGALQDLLLRKDLVLQQNLGERAPDILAVVRVAPDLPIAQAMARLDEAGTGALALCLADGTLQGILTDGDIRRAILDGVSLEEPCRSIAVDDPVTAQDPVSPTAALRLMSERDINQLPVVDDEGRLVHFLLRKDLAPLAPAELTAVVMAGGYGKRLLPLTEHTPKPMLPIGDRPLLERTIEQLRRSGIQEVNLTTHYLPEHIVEHFGDGEDFGVRISYTREDHPLGTAGGLKSRARAGGPFLVLNGDVLTGVSFDEMLRYHRKNGAELTVGVRKYEVKVPFGVIESDESRVTRLKEKPSLSFLINAGIYVLEPSACDFIPENQYFDMTDLINTMLAKGRTVVSFPIIEYWLDVGRQEDYQQAQEDVRNGRI